LLFPVAVLALLACFCVYAGLRLIPQGWPAAAQITSWLVLASAIALPAGGLIAFGRRARSERLFMTLLAPLGVFVMVLTLTALRDIVWLVALLAHLLPEDPDVRRRIFDVSSAAVVASGVALFVVGLVRARSGPRVVSVKVPIENLAPALQGFTIAQISDVHIGRSLMRPFLESVVAAVNGVGADLVAVTGDLVDGSVDALREHTAPLANLKAKHGAWFVPGNHDYYSGVLEWIAELERLGVNVLLNEHVVLDHQGHKFVVGGVTDHGQGRYVEGHASDPHKAIAGAPADAFKLLLAHQPASAKEAAKAGFHLQLSGHTHGGQFFPGTLFAHLIFPFVAGLHRLEEMWIYISSGTGYVGPALRTTRTTTEITRLVLVRA
jgi:predicted MPP superfamily phosphohydrolase